LKEKKSKKRFALILQ